MERNSVITLCGQLIVGTLILQDCAVELLFALLTILGGTSGFLQGMMFMTKSDMLGLSPELGAFAAGVMISTTDLAQHTLEQVEPIRNFFAALFLASIGMLIHVHFLWNHIDILLASVLLVIAIKTIVVAIVVKGFRYNNKTSFLGILYLLLLGTTALNLVTDYTIAFQADSRCSS